MILLFKFIQVFSKPHACLFYRWQAYPEFLITYQIVKPEGVVDTLRQTWRREGLWCDVLWLLRTTFMHCFICIPTPHLVLGQTIRFLWPVGARGVPSRSSISTCDFREFRRCPNKFAVPIGNSVQADLCDLVCNCALVEYCYSNGCAVLVWLDTICLFYWIVDSVVLI